MNRKRIERFLATLAQQLNAPARVYLVGAGAAALWGRVRPSIDIDLGIQPTGRPPVPWDDIAAALARTTALTGIPTSAAQDIDRWGMITLLDYRRTSRSYQRFGKLDVRLLHPINWSIGKLTRYLDPDVGDVVAVFKSQRVAFAEAARTWGRALRASPPSSVQFQFRHATSMKGSGVPMAAALTVKNCGERPKAVS